MYPSSPLSPTPMTTGWYEGEMSGIWGGAVPPENFRNWCFCKFDFDVHYRMHNTYLSLNLGYPTIMGHPCSNPGGVLTPEQPRIVAYNCVVWTFSVCYIFDGVNCSVCFVIVDDNYNAVAVVRSKVSFAQLCYLSPVRSLGGLLFSVFDPVCLSLSVCRWKQNKCFFVP